MNILQDRDNRYCVKYMACLTGCFVLMACFLSWFHGKETQGILFEREQTIISSLVEQGVAAEMIAAAVKNAEITDEGIALMGKLGRTGSASAGLFPEIDRSVHLFAKIAVGVVVILASLLAGITFRFFRKREKLYEKAEDVITQFSEGNFGNHLPQNENGSIYRLFAAVEELAVALQAQSEKEQHMKVFLRDTISDISHQLKTPLAAIHMYTEIIAREPENRETVERFSGKTMLSLNRIEQLVQELLKVSRIDAGSVVFLKEEQAASALVKEAMEDLSERAQKEGKQMLVRGEARETLFCDRQWTREAVANLIKNALDHTEEGGVVTVSWERTPGAFRLSVADDGCGIAGEDIHHVFKRFYRSKGEGGRQGIGLGLSLAKAVVEGQGGILSVESRPGEGAVFTILFLTDL